MITSVAKDLIHRQRHAVLDQLQISQIYLMQPVTQGLMQQGGAATLSIGDGTSCFQELYSRREMWARIQFRILSFASLWIFNANKDLIPETGHKAA